MELNHAVVTTPPRPAATVVLLRDGDAGLEVLLLKRHGQSASFGGAYVFPGGKLDREDADPDLLARLDTPADALRARMNEPDLDATEAAALFVAALRETFEESHVLLACEVQAAHCEAAARRAREGEAFGDVIAALDLRLAASSMVPWSRWITPRMPSSMTNKRFDTRFFVAHVPEGLTARHDEREATDAAWLRPRTALEMYWARDIELAPPQIQSLAHLARYASADEAIADARRRAPPLIQPHPFEEDGHRVIAYPGDPLHPVRERALPGPLRLRHRDGRFEPIDGFDTFFA